MHISVGVWIYFSSEKKEFDRFFDRLDRPVEESRPDRFASLNCTLLHDKPLIDITKCIFKIKKSNAYF